jgi:hypothetical protein
MPRIFPERIRFKIGDWWDRTFRARQPEVTVEKDCDTLKVAGLGVMAGKKLKAAASSPASFTEPIRSAAVEFTSPTT